MAKTELPTVEERCETCRHWRERAPATDARRPLGECHREGPTVFQTAAGGFVTRWPEIVADGCGAWRVKAAAGQTLESPMDLAYHASAANMSTEDLERLIRYKSTAMGMRAAIAVELARRYTAQRAADISFARLQHGPG